MYESGVVGGLVKAKRSALVVVASRTGFTGTFAILRAGGGSRPALAAILADSTDIGLPEIAGASAVG